MSEARTATRLDWRSMTDTEKCAAVAVRCGWAKKVDGAGGDGFWWWNDLERMPDYLHDPRASDFLIESMVNADGLTVTETRMPGMSVIRFGSVYSSSYNNPHECRCIAFLRSKGIEVVT